MTTTTLLRLLQLADSGFPTGGYSFSHGLEGLHAMALVVDEGGVREFALAQIEETLAQQDIPAVSHAHRFASAADIDALVELDHLLSALKPVPAFRKASTRIGRQTLESALPLFPGEVAHRYLDATRQGNTPANHAVVFGVTAQAAGIGETDAISAFGASALGSYVAAAVRLGIIGQGAAQRIIASLQPALAEAIGTAQLLGLADMGGYSPLIDIAGMRQPVLAARMFAS